MNSAIIFNQNPMAEERVIHFHKCNAINVRDFSGPTGPKGPPGDPWTIEGVLEDRIVLAYTDDDAPVLYVGDDFYVINSQMAHF